MADIGSLPNFLSDVADAIRETSAIDEKFTPSEFDEKIRNIPKESSGIEKIQKNGIDLEIVNKTVNIELDKSDVGLSNVENTSDMEKPISTATKEALDNKVDKEEGKGLSTNDYTNEDKAKLIPTGGTTGQVLAKQSDTDNDTVWIDPAGGQASGDTLPVGSIMPYPKATAPENWLACDGSAVSRTDYSELFSAIGTTFGAGDGSTTFNLPNFKGKVPVGLDATDTDFNEVGKTAGEKTHTLTIAEMPKHSHNIVASHGTSTSGIAFYPAENITTPYDTLDFNICRPAGGNDAHNNLQPSIVTNYIIKAKQSAGLVATVVDSLDSTSATDALSAKQGKALNEKITKSSTYSTDEQAVGTWIDGKTIYRKVINFGILPNATSKLVPHNISNLKNFVKIEGIAIRDDNFAQMLPLVYRGIDTEYNTSLAVTNTQISIICDNDRTNFTAYVTLEYTKTTD